MTKMLQPKEKNILKRTNKSKTLFGLERNFQTGTWTLSVNKEIIIWYRHEVVNVISCYDFIGGHVPERWRKVVQGLTL